MFCFLLNWRKNSNYFKIAVWWSDSMKRNFGGFTFNLHLLTCMQASQTLFYGWTYVILPGHQMLKFALNFEWLLLVNDCDQVLHFWASSRHYLLFFASAFTDVGIIKVFVLFSDLISFVAESKKEKIYSKSILTFNSSIWITRCTDLCNI